MFNVHYTCRVKLLIVLISTHEKYSVNVTQNAINAIILRQLIFIF